MFHRAKSPSKSSFDIATRLWHLDGATVTAASGRAAEIYVFAWHPQFDAACDQTAVEQWEYYVVRERDLPKQKTITLGRIVALGTSTTRASAATLSIVVESTVEDLRHTEAQLRCFNRRRPDAGPTSGQPLH